MSGIRIGYSNFTILQLKGWSQWHDRLDIRLRISMCGVPIRDSPVTDILSRDETDVKLGFKPFFTVSLVYSTVLLCTELCRAAQDLMFYRIYIMPKHRLLYSKIIYILLNLL